MIITQNGEAKAVLQDIASYEESQETMALLKVLALGKQQIKEGNMEPAASVLGRFAFRGGAFLMVPPVLLTRDAARDLEENFAFIKIKSSPERAVYVLDRLQETFNKLFANPRRNTYPQELLALDIKNYREFFSNPTV